jgi:hypothetical protein
MLHRHRKPEPICTAVAAIDPPPVAARYEVAAKIYGAADALVRRAEEHELEGHDLSLEPALSKGSAPKGAVTVHQRGRL